MTVKAGKAWLGEKASDRNSNDVLLLDVCAGHSLSITNTMFKHKGVIGTRATRMQVDDSLCCCVI